jgi:hypothetical protein
MTGKTILPFKLLTTFLLMLLSENRCRWFLSERVKANLRIVAERLRVACVTLSDVLRKNFVLTLRFHVVVCQ